MIAEINQPLNNIEQLGHEQVVYCYDKASGLKAIIAIHNTNLGPALGGTRMWPYATEEQALFDVLRLSRGMTYKAALAGLNLGGGKAVIVGDPKKDKSPQLFQKFGEYVNNLNGKYYTAEDVGINTEDIREIHKKTNYVTGKPLDLGGSGDPSPSTAYGVFIGMKSAAHKAFGSNVLENVRVLVQGVGSVGQNLIRLLHEAGAKILVTDIFEEKLKQISKQYPVEIVSPESWMEKEFDIYAPCALGATLHDQTIPKLKCKVIAGAANNQLYNEKVHAEMLTKRDIIYAPDYLINSGGIINCNAELEHYSTKDVINKISKIYDTLDEVFEISDSQKITTHQAANTLAENRIYAKK